MNVLNGFAGSNTFEKTIHMQDKDFIKLMTKTGTKMLIIGFSITAFAVFMIWLAMSGADSEMTQGTMIGLLIFAGIFLLVGLLMIIMPLNTSSKIKNGKHGLVNALLNNDANYIVWYYEHIINVKSGPAKNSAHKIWIYSADDKHYSVDVKKTQVSEVIQYLGSKFPTATAGYTAEIEKDYRARMKARKG
jgi:hypothetical protein